MNFDFVARKGIAVVTEKDIAVVVRMTQGRVVTYRPDAKGDAIERCVATLKLAPGAYRITLVGNFIRGFSLSGEAKKVNLEREVAKLEASGAGTTRARTGSPGICFYGGRSYQRCENMSQAAGDYRRQESRYMAQALRELMAK